MGKVFQSTGIQVVRRICRDTVLVHELPYIKATRGGGGEIIKAYLTISICSCRVVNVLTHPPVYRQ